MIWLPSLKNNTSQRGCGLHFSLVCWTKLLLQLKLLLSPPLKTNYNNYANVTYQQQQKGESTVQEKRDEQNTAVLSGDKSNNKSETKLNKIKFKKRYLIKNKRTKTHNTRCMRSCLNLFDSQLCSFVLPQKDRSTSLYMLTLPPQQNSITTDVR